MVFVPVHPDEQKFVDTALHLVKEAGRVSLSFQSFLFTFLMNLVILGQNFGMRKVLLGKGGIFAKI